METIDRSLSIPDGPVGGAPLPQIDDDVEVHSSSPSSPVPPYAAASPYSSTSSTSSDPIERAYGGALFSINPYFESLEMLTSLPK